MKDLKLITVSKKYFTVSLLFSKCSNLFCETYFTFHLWLNSTLSNILDITHLSRSNCQEQAF